MARRSAADSKTDFVEVDGLRIAYRRVGIGPALVMLQHRQLTRSRRERR
jgi:hypothetical protein